MKALRIGNVDFAMGKRTYLMGILNVTPDSFSDGGLYYDVDMALERAVQMQEEGADIIDVGGESTRPGHVPVEAEEEMRRVIPVIERLSKRLEIPVSIDTSKAVVAEEAVRAGAAFINDVWGGEKDPAVLDVVAKYHLPCCLMHNKEEAVYENLPEEVLDWLRNRAATAVAAGVDPGGIVLDPGIGFGKTVEQNIEMMRNLHRINQLGYPWLLGASRKSMIGKTLNLPSDERVEGTIVTTVAAVQAGCSFVRVHDIIENLRAARMADRIFRREDGFDG